MTAGPLETAPATDPRALDVSVIIVSYNSADDLPGCLESLTADLDGLSAEVVVVDNASRDATVELLRRDWPQVTLLASPHNEGFARAANRGVAASTGRCILLLNPDTVVRAGAVAALLRAAAARPYAGIYGGRTVDRHGRLDPRSCWGAPTLWSTACFALGLSSLRKRSPLFDPESLGSWLRDTEREVDVVTGCLLLARRDAWDELGGFDERYFMYGEDVDLSVRAARSGWRPVIVPAAEVVHHVGASSASSLAKSRLLFAGKLTYADQHLRSRRGQPWGARMLIAGVALRAAAVTVAQRAGARPRGDWRELWRERDSWRHGFPAVAPRSHEGAGLSP